jgi:NADH-quinone oxidoreductase subunit M
MWPVHTWLPDAHVEAPTGGSVILAAIMLKIGGYGFLRFSLPITPDASQELDWLIITLSLIAVVYIGFVAPGAAGHEEADRLLVDRPHGLRDPGLLHRVQHLAQHRQHSGAAMGMQGGMVQMISHGFISGALFLCVGVLYDRMHSREIADYGGVVNTMPVFAAFMVLFAMANAGLPGTSGFVGEFMVILALQGQLLVRLPGRHHPDPRRRLHPVDGQAGDLRRGGNDKVAEAEDINGASSSCSAPGGGGCAGSGLWPAPLVE